MRKRTDAEIKAYVDGYNNCYKMFSDFLNSIVYSNKYPSDVADAIRIGMYHMNIVKSAVNGAVESRGDEHI